MDFSVTRLSHGLVPPLEPTPVGVLDLSVIDRQPVLRCNARTLHVFKHINGGPTPTAEVIRRALSKALVPYYPLAGRLTFHSSVDNPLARIECSGEGIWFVEACVDRSLEEMKYFEDAMTTIPLDTLNKLLPPHPNAADGLDPLVLMQITKFKCNGFVMGLTFCHTICDGLGAAQFLKAVGEMAQGADKPSITPSWSRDLIQSPPLEAYSNSFPKMPLPPPIPTYQLEHTTIDIPLDYINRQKQIFRAQTGGRNCSSFEIVAASFWKRRTHAISDSLREETELKLVFFSNCRQFIHPSLPQGYYGNCFFPVTITASNGMLSRASIGQVVKLIQQAKADLPNEFAKWINGGVVQDVDPFLPPMLYTTLFISEWGRLGFNEVDYGWGRPVHVVPIQGSSVIPVGIVGCPPCPRAGIRLMTWCVEKAHLQSLTYWRTDFKEEEEN